MPWELGLDEDPEQMLSREDLGHRDAAYEQEFRERGFKYGSEERGYGGVRTFYGDDRDYGFGTQQGTYAGFRSSEDDDFDGSGFDPGLDVRITSAPPGLTDHARDSYLEPVRDWQRPQSDDFSLIPPSQQAGGRSRSFAGVGPKNYRRPDESIREEVVDRLTENAHLDASELDVRLEDGLVVLGGTTEDRRSKRLAEEIATSVRGVLDVRNEIRVKA